MSNERLSVALIQDDGGKQERMGVRKDDSFFDNKYLGHESGAEKALLPGQMPPRARVYRNTGRLGGSRGIRSIAPTSGGGIVPKSETEYEVKKGFLDEKINDLTNDPPKRAGGPVHRAGDREIQGFPRPIHGSKLAFLAAGCPSGGCHNRRKQYSDGQPRPRIRSLPSTSKRPEDHG